ncbi:MAG: sugar ABC transporter substrate-binding protein [Solirubrobacteraceae bacterium]
MAKEPEIVEVDCSKLNVRALRTRREAMAVGAGGLAAFLLAACGGGSGSSTSGATGGGTAAATATTGGAVGEGKTIALSLNGFNVYDQCLATGVLEALAGTQYKFIGAQANFDSPTEIKNIQNLVAKQPDGLLIQPNTMASANRGALEASRAGIPVLNLLYSGPDEPQDSYVAATQVDGVKGGKMIADYLGQTVKQGKILVVVGVPGQGFSEDITKGLKQGLGAYPDLQIAAMQPGLFTAGPAQKAVQTMLTAHPDAKVIVDYAAEMGNGIAAFLKARNITGIHHVTSDGNPEMVPILKAGRYIQADRYYSSAQQGLMGTKILRDYMETGKKPDQFVTQVPQAMVTSDTIVAKVADEPLIYRGYESQVKAVA